MGNNHSSPICKRICLGSTTPPLHDDGEWFGSLPREKSFRKSSRTSTPKMPVVPEESESPDGAERSDERSGSDNTSLISNLSRDVSADFATNMSETEPNLFRSFSESQPPKVKEITYRRLSDGVDLKDSQVTRSPHVKLTFINGQFLDLTTVEGKEMAAAARAAESGLESTTSEVRSNELCGIEASIYAGHGGILNASKNSESKPNSDSASAARKRLNSWGITRAASDASNGSEASAKTTTTKESNSSALNRDGASSKNAVTSIVSLDEGYFLTASKYDSVIKMWRATEKSVTPSRSTAKSHIEFVRDFVGHNTGVTCIARVDSKGRFLSASKDCSVILWDSRYSCGDDEEWDEENRTILARFEKMDQRAVKSIALTEEGSYVRPTDNIDFAMIKAAARKTIIAGSAGLQQAAREKHVIGCTCGFASITGHHNSVKIWSIQHSEDQNGIEAEGNRAEVTMDQELNCDIVVQSLTAALGKGIILTGDRMGNIKLWRGGRGMLGQNRTWTCERIFSWKKKSDLCSIRNVMNSTVTAVSFLSDEIFVSGHRGGVLRLWKVDNDKDLVSINGAHNDQIVDIQLGCFERKHEDKCVSFSSASADGKVLSFLIIMGQNDKGRPLCYNVVSHGISCRYLTNHDSISVEALECVDVFNTRSCSYRKAMISACSGGDINILKAHLAPGPQSQDALVLYRKQIEEEALTLHALVPDMLNAIELRDRKKNMFTYKQCFLGCDAVSYLVDDGHALTRNDALDLGRILASHLSLFRHVSCKSKLLEDDESFYRFSGDWVKNRVETRTGARKSLSVRK